MTGSTTVNMLDEASTDASELDRTESQHPLMEAGQQAADSASHLASRAADIGLQQADRGRELAATGIHHVAETIRRVSLDLETDQPAIADVAGTAAQQAERVATYLRDTDARQIVSNVEQVARRQPLLFLGAAFVLGAVASRFVKAAGDRTDTADSSRLRAYAPATSYEATGPGASRGNEGF